MDASLEVRLNADSPFYDASLFISLAKLGGDYVKNGLAVLNFYVNDFDCAYDVANALAALPDGTTFSQFDKTDRSNSRNYSHPCGSTQLEVLATAISQILFGGETNRRVEARNDDDETKAEAVNQLLAWNDAQNDSYATGYDWVMDSIITNRGIMYDHWCHLYETEKEAVEYTMPYVAEIDPVTKKKLPKPADYQPVKKTRWRTVQKPAGGYSKLEVISPYDFICDPALPIKDMQRGRYAGHRVTLTWQELKRRSELDPEDYDYVLPKVVEKLKNAKARKGLTGIAASNTTTTSTSRSYWERQRRGMTTPDLGMTDKVNKDDGGTVECWLITVRAKPKTVKIYEDDEYELIEMLIAGETDLLSVNIKTNAHGQFPYAVGESRPGAHQQFTPGRALMMKPTQDMIDVLKGAHAEQVERAGSLFLGDGTKCDVAQVLTDKTRVRQLILKNEEAGNTPNEQILQQIKVDDPTREFVGEMTFWQQIMEQTSGANAPIQGQTEDPGQTLGQYQDVQQMAMGRLSTIARNLSSRSLVPQTRRIVMDLQQFMPDTMKLRITGDNDAEYDPDEPPPKYIDIRREPITAEDLQAMEGDSPEVAMQKAAAGEQPIPRDPRLGDDDATAQQKISRGEVPNPPDPTLTAPDIQFGFDVTPHDGSMPGTDARAVAAAARVIEASANPAFQACFDNTVPGNIDPKALIVWTARKAGLPVKNFLITRETAQKNAKERLMAAGGGMQPPEQPWQPPPLPTAGAPIGQPAAPPPPPQDPFGQPSAAMLPPNPSAEPPQAQGVTLAL